MSLKINWKKIWAPVFASWLLLSKESANTTRWDCSSQLQKKPIIYYKVLNQEQLLQEPVFKRVFRNHWYQSMVPTVAAALGQPLKTVFCCMIAEAIKHQWGGGGGGSLHEHKRISKRCSHSPLDSKKLFCFWAELSVEKKLSADMSKKAKERWSI